VIAIIMSIDEGEARKRKSRLFLLIDLTQPPKTATGATSINA
jgi:hypothetical protein